MIYWKRVYRNNELFYGLKVKRGFIYIEGKIKSNLEKVPQGKYIRDYENGFKEIIEDVGYL